eukprot:GFKZ01006781.1.p1 GENE.GFKZ01006781.1~~GFKZ01006781.1.p1  ORF type:complete len:289 (-),score=42.88 GFKZ01006781.1:686-1552(-)
MLDQSLSTARAPHIFPSNTPAMPEQPAFLSTLPVSQIPHFAPPRFPIFPSHSRSYRKPRSQRCILQARTPRPPSSPPPTTPVEPGLKVPRQSVESAARSGRAFRLRRFANLSDLDIHDNPDSDSEVQVAAVVQRIRRDYRIRGKTRASLPRKCDRCAKEYVAESKGDFELWLATDESGQLEMSDDELAQVEAVEMFPKGVAEVDLTAHVRDSVYLGMPTKSLCSADCQGIDVRQGNAGSVTYAVNQEAQREEAGDAERVEEGSRTMADVAGVGEQLRQLKERLERAGL